MNKYNEIMENIKVSDEMRDRVLSNIDKEFENESHITSSKLQDKKNNNIVNFRKIGRIAAIFAMMIVGLGAAALVLGRFGNHGEQSATMSEEAAYDFTYETEPLEDAANDKEAMGDGEFAEGDAYNIESEEGSALEPGAIEGSVNVENEKKASFFLDNTGSSREVCLAFVSDEFKIDGKSFSEKYESIITETGEKPDAFYFDANGDGIGDLLVDKSYYGFDIYFCDGDTLKFITGGDGLDDVTALYEREGNVYIGHSDIVQVGREHYEFCQYDMEGNITESIKYDAEFEDSKTDTYDENSIFLKNDESISMEEYEEELASFSYINEDSMEKISFGD